MTLKIYGYEVSAVAMGTCRGSEKRPERGSKPLGKKCTQFLAKDSYLSSPQMDFQCTSLLPNPGITRCCTIVARTKKLASLVSSSPTVQVFFSETKLWEITFFSKVMQINISKRMFSVVD